MTAVPPCEPFCGPIPPGGIVPPFLSIAGEISFGFVIDRLATDPATAVAFAPFSWVQPAAALIGATLEFPGIILNPVSNLFDSPSSGHLRYIGDAPARFAIHGQSGFIWLSGNLEGPFLDVFLMSIGVNDDIGNGHSGWASPRIAATIPDPLAVPFPGAQIFAAGSMHAQGLYELEPGDDVTLGIAVQLQPPGSTVSLLMAQYSLMAYKI